MQILNLYAYVNNNPLIYTDPTGLFLIGIIIGGAIIGGAVAGAARPPSGGGGSSGGNNPIPSMPPPGHNTGGGSSSGGSSNNNSGGSSNSNPSSPPIANLLLGSVVSNMVSNAVSNVIARATNNSQMALLSAPTAPQNPTWLVSAVEYAEARGVHVRLTGFDASEYTSGAIGASNARVGIAQFSLNGSSVSLRGTMVNGSLMIDERILARALNTIGATTAHTPAFEREYVGNYEAFLVALGFRESSSRYHVTSPSGTFLGKYQLGPMALQDIGFMNADRTWTSLARQFGVTDNQSFLNSPTAQEYAIRAYHQRLWRSVENWGHDERIGTTFTGTLAGSNERVSIEITASGLLAGAHLVGPGNDTNNQRGLEFMFRTGIIPVDGNGMPATRYMSDFGNYDLSNLHNWRR